MNRGVPVVTVVTVVHGRHEHLREQHRSLARGDRVPDRVVVVAMGDPDVAGVVAESPLADRTTLLGLPCGDRLPLARARNVGAAAALARDRSGLLVFLDVDCLAAPTLAAGYLDAWSRAPSVPRLLGGTVSYLPPPPVGGYDGESLALAPPHPARPVPSPGEVVPAADVTLFWSLSFAVDAESWRATGGFDEAFEGYGAEDTDFGQRARHAGLSLWWVGSAHAYHQWHPVSDPPVEHLDDIVRNAHLFHRRWGWFPMPGWLDAFAREGLVDWDAAAGRLRVLGR